MVSLTQHEFLVVILPLLLNQQQTGLGNCSADGLNLAIACFEIEHHRVCILAPPAQMQSRKAQCLIQMLVAAACCKRLWHGIELRSSRMTDSRLQAWLVVGISQQRLPSAKLTNHTPCSNGPKSACWMPMSTCWPQAGSFGPADVSCLGKAAALLCQGLQ